MTQQRLCWQHVIIKSTALICVKENVLFKNLLFGFIVVGYISYRTSLTNRLSYGRKKLRRIKIVGRMLKRYTLRRYIIVAMRMHTLSSRILFIVALK